MNLSYTRTSSRRIQSGKTLCQSWYNANQVEAPITALWPGSTLHYIEYLGEVRWDDLEMKYNENRWVWLGNAFSQGEADETADWAYCIFVNAIIGTREDLSKGKRKQILTRSGTVTGPVNLASLLG
jgi:hypothetical protein